MSLRFSTSPLSLSLSHPTFLFLSLSLMEKQNLLFFFSISSCFFLFPLLSGIRTRLLVHVLLPLFYCSFFREYKNHFLNKILLPPYFYLFITHFLEKKKEKSHFVVDSCSETVNDTGFLVFFLVKNTESAKIVAKQGLKSD